MMVCCPRSRGVVDNSRVGDEGQVAFHQLLLFLDGYGGDGILVMAQEGVLMDLKGLNQGCCKCQGWGQPSSKASICSWMPSTSVVEL